MNMEILFRRVDFSPTYFAAKVKSALRAGEVDGRLLRAMKLPK